MPPALIAHLHIMRLDHWIKNVFVLPGVVIGLTVDPARAQPAFIPTFLLGFLAVGLISSSNYVLNEVLDAPHDREHPVKRRRPVPSGLVGLPLAYVQWAVLMLGGLALGAVISASFTLALLALWIMGCLYNVAPIRTKDIPYLDVLSEAVNTPLRMLAGWLIVGLPPSTIPLSLLMSSWMIGGYFMAIKRFAEFRELGGAIAAARYRPSFATYSEARLLTSIVFYASAAMLFLGAFIMRYRLELILAFPLLALVMSIYLALAFQPDSPVQAPENLYREPLLVAALVACAAVMAITPLFSRKAEESRGHRKGAAFPKGTN